MEDTKQAVSSRLNRTDAHVNSQRLWQDARGLHRFKPDGVPVLRGKSGHELPSLTKKLSTISICLQRKKLVLFNSVSLGILTTH